MGDERKEGIHPPMISPQFLFSERKGKALFLVTFNIIVNYCVFPKTSSSPIEKNQVFSLQLQLFRHIFEFVDISLLQ